MKRLRCGRVLAVILAVSLVVVLSSSGCLGEYVKFGDPQVQEGGSIISYAIDQRYWYSSEDLSLEVWLNGRRWISEGCPPGSYWAQGNLEKEAVDYWCTQSYPELYAEHDTINVNLWRHTVTSYRLRVANTTLTYPVTVELRDGDRVLDKFTLNYGPDVNPYLECPAEGKITGVKLKRYRGYAIGENGSEYSVVFFVNTYGQGFRRLEGYLDSRYYLISPASPPDNPCEWANLTYSMNYFGTLPFSFNLTLKTPSGRLIDSVVVGARTEEEIEPLN
ncbi:Uncharacterised protein [uncultured archaeon]|nr:Uncharacterised protein [uncultured archaeon]